MTDWQIWKTSAATTRARLGRIIRNTSRFNDSTFSALLARIDSAIQRDGALLSKAMESET